MASRISFPMLSQDVRDWLVSETVVNRIGALNDRLNLTGERRPTIATLVYRIVTRDLEPHQSAPTLASALGMNRQEAQSLSKNIFEQVFRPIERTLRNELNIEVADMARDDFEESEVRTTPVVASETQKPELKRVDFGVSEPAPKLAPARAQAVEQAPEPRPRLTEPEIDLGDRPFLIHEEKSSAFPQAPRESRSPFGFRPIPEPRPKPAETKPVTVRIETPGTPKQPASRVVHYSNLRTPLEDTDAKDTR